MARVHLGFKCVKTKHSGILVKMTDAEFVNKIEDLEHIAIFGFDGNIIPQYTPFLPRFV